MATQKQPWERMQVTVIGHVSQVLRGGGGKISIPAGDSGEPFKKPPGWNVSSNPDADPG